MPAFALQARPPGIYKQEYINELFRRYDDVEAAPAGPALPDWCLGRCSRLSCCSYRMCLYLYADICRMHYFLYILQLKLSLLLSLSIYYTLLKPD